MASLNGGWNVTASATNAIAIAAKGIVPNRQDIIFGISASFSGTPSSPVLLQIVDPDVSPNVVLFEDYVPVAGGLSRSFPGGISVAPGHNVEAILLAGGSAIVGKVNLHGVSL